MTIQMPEAVAPQSDDRRQRVELLQKALTERILVLDGATGTALQDAGLSAADFDRPEWEGCNEALCVTRPDVILDVHRRYLAAGADIVETNSFGSTPLVLQEFGAADHAFDWSREAARLARVAVCEVAGDKPRFVCGSMGPTTKSLSVTGGVSYEELIDHFAIQALGLMVGGADYLLLETCQDTLNIKAGVVAAQRAFAHAGWSVPLAVSVTIEPNGTMLAGQDAEALAVSLSHLDLLYLGINCATGPDLMADSLRTLSDLANCPVACVPNAGLPNEDGAYEQTGSDFVQAFNRFLEENWINLAGGCCGTTSEHVSALAGLVAGREPRQPLVHRRTLISGVEAAELDQDNRPLLVGERTNVLGSRKFKRLIEDGDFETAAEVGRGQVRGGAQVLDVCLQDPERDEATEVERFFDLLTRKVRVPLMIDTTDPQVMEVALKKCQGKAVLNSVNLEDGEQRFRAVAKLARSYGAAVVVGLIDERGMAVSVDRKLGVARRSAAILESEGIQPQDVWWDALVFPCGTGDPNYVGSAASTLEGVERLKKEFPFSPTILGVSNVSFGLPPAGREVLNSVFLHRATIVGLDAAIVNTEKLARFAEIADRDRELCDRLLELRTGEIAEAEVAVQLFTEYFRKRKMTTAKPRSAMPLDERLSNAVIEGNREFLDEDLEAALADAQWPNPLAIINGPLMAGMDEVGRRFNANELIVAEVLQSAEVMKAAVDQLRPHMDREETASRGRVLLATVKGDVHDIGKNLVDIVLSNNGFDVVNLGIKVTSEVLIQGIREHQPDLIGLSGLLVKSAHQMVATAADLRQADIDVPLLVGGAALSRRFTHKRISSEYAGLCTYAKDAMQGLELVRRATDPDSRSELELEVTEQQEADRSSSASRPDRGSRGSSVVSKGVTPLEVVPTMPDRELHSEEFHPEDVWTWVNPQMLFGKHLGLRGSVRKLAADGDAKYLQVAAAVEEAKQIWIEHGFAVRGNWRFVEARVERQRVAASVDGIEESGWEFPRQRQGELLSLVDYLRSDGDSLGIFAVTVDRRVGEVARELKERGQYLASHTLAALGLETAEAAAELVHRRMRQGWGFGDPADLTVAEVLKGKYRGRRYSFGYPACPDLSGQRLLLKMLDSESIDLKLTDGDMMDPEASVSALVFHHPEAKYFSTEIVDS